MTGVEAAERLSAGRVLAILLGLVVVVAAIAGLARPTEADADGSALVAEWFGLEEPLPVGLEVRSASRYALGEEVVCLGFGEAPALPEPIPSDVYLLRYPLRTANGEIAELFEDPGTFGADGEEGGPSHEPGAESDDGFRDWGQLDWHDYRAPYVHVRERDAESEPFVDTLRVNLSQPGFACVLVARWEPDVEGRKEPVAELLQHLPPRPL